MKRSGPPERRKGLDADPEKVREFVQRGRQSSRLSRATGPKRGKTPRKGSRASTGRTLGPLDPDRWRRAIWELCEGCCAGCGVYVPWRVTRPINFHHPIPKAKLPPERRFDPRNGVVVCADCHANQEVASHRIPGENLPESVFNFARELGSWAVSVLDALHPKATQPGDPGATKEEP